MPAFVKSSHPTSSAEETTALLKDSEPDPIGPATQDVVAHETLSNREGSEDDDDKPLPMAQILILCYARLAEPMTFFSIFPFVSQMIWDTGEVKEADVGFYAGLIESLFSLVQMLLMVLWGRGADRFGRKPVLVFSLAGMSIATALFGFSKAIWQMIMFRCLGGICAGAVVAIRTMISENSTQRTQARAFSFFAVTGNLGIFLGPLLGGALANPAGQYPRVFGGYPLFIKYPYALPTIVSGALTACAAVICLLLLKETLDSKAADKSSNQQTMSTRDLLNSPGVPIVLLIYGYVGLLATGYTAVIPVFYFTDVALGGYGFTPLQISLFIALAGLSQSLWLLFAFPPLQRRLGTGGVLRGCAMVWPAFFVMVALGNMFLRQGWNLTFWIVTPIALVIGSGVAMSFTAVQLAVNDIKPSPQTLGTLNAIALTLASGIRAVTPAAFGSLYAAGVKKQILDGYLIFFVLILLTLVLNVPLRWFPAKAEGRVKHDDSTH